jgi:hypothetical protein
LRVEKGVLRTYDSKDTRGLLRRFVSVPDAADAPDAPVALVSRSAA